MKRAFTASAALSLLIPLVTHAADHLDSPRAEGEPSADISDVFAWMSADASKVNLVLDVSPFAASGSAFSDAVQYVFHVSSSAEYGGAPTETLIICHFDDNAHIQCWGGAGEYVKGDASGAAGLANDSGRLRVFAGLRNDPFFMELDGFTETVRTVVEAAPGLTFDAHGCPALDSATSSLLVGKLQSGTAGAAASDTFAGSNVLAIVVQIDKSILTGGGPVLGVWASTHRRN